MTRIELGWYQRISVWLRVGGVQAPNMQVASILYRVIEKIRPTEEERGKSNLVTSPRGYEWQLPDINYGTVTVELEAEECEQLAQVMENLPQGTSVLVADMAWIVPLIEKLKGGVPKKQEEEKELVRAA